MSPLAMMWSSTWNRNICEEDLVQYLWCIGLNNSVDAGAMLCFTLNISIKIWKILIWYTFRAFSFLIMAWHVFAFLHNICINSQGAKKLSRYQDIWNFTILQLITWTLSRIYISGYIIRYLGTYYMLFMRIIGGTRLVEE